MRAATNTSVASLGGLWERTMRTSTGPSSTTRSGVRDHGRTRGRCIHSRADIIYRSTSQMRPSCWAHLEARSVSYHLVSHGRSSDQTSYHRKGSCTRQLIDWILEPVNFEVELLYDVRLAWNLNLSVATDFHKSK
jgi:hypothetical protein